MTLLSVDKLGARHGLLQAVHQMSFEVAQGETLALVGANGAGKTTLLRAIAGAHRPSEGRVMFDGEDVTARPAFERARRGMALVPEGRRLFGHMTVEENLRVAAAAHRSGRWTVDEVLETFPLLAPLRNRKAALLSGGEQQATAIGRALMANPTSAVARRGLAGAGPDGRRHGLRLDRAPDRSGHDDRARRAGPRRARWPSRRASSACSKAGWCSRAPLRT